MTLVAKRNIQVLFITASCVTFRLDERCLSESIHPARNVKLLLQTLVMLSDKNRNETFRHRPVKPLRYWLFQCRQCIKQYNVSTLRMIELVALF